MVRGQYIDTVKWSEGVPPSFDQDGNPIIGGTVNFENDRCRYENFLKGGNRQEYVNRDGNVVLATGAIYFKGSDAVVPKRFTVVDMVLANAPDNVDPLKLEILSINYGQFNKVAYVCQVLI